MVLIYSLMSSDNSFFLQSLQLWPLLQDYPALVYEDIVHWYDMQANSYCLPKPLFIKTFLSWYPVQAWRIPKLTVYLLHVRMHTHIPTPMPLCCEKGALWQVHYKPHTGQLSVLGWLSPLLYLQTAFDPTHLSLCLSGSFHRYNISTLKPSWIIPTAFKDKESIASFFSLAPDESQIMSSLIIPSPLQMIQKIAGIWITLIASGRWQLNRSEEVPASEESRKKRDPKAVEGG